MGIDAKDEEHFAEEVGRHVFILGAKKIPQASHSGDIPRPQPSDDQTEKPASLPQPSPGNASPIPQPIPGNEVPTMPTPQPDVTDCAKAPVVSANCDNLDSVKLDYQYVGLMYNSVDKRIFWSAGNETETVSNRLLELCQQGSGSPGHCIGNQGVSSDCVAIAINPLDESGWAIGSGSTASHAMSIAKRSCLEKNGSCTVRFTYCAL
jgi:hypothetical protein